MNITPALLQPHWNIHPSLSAIFLPQSMRGNRTHSHCRPARHTLEFYLRGTLLIFAKHLCLLKTGHFAHKSTKQIQLHHKTTFVLHWSSFHHRRLPIKSESVQHNPTGSILRIRKAVCFQENLHCRGQSANGLGLQKQDHTIQRNKRRGDKRQMQPLEKGEKESEHTWFQSGWGVDPQMYLCTLTALLSSSKPEGIDCEHMHSHAHTSSVTWPLQH